MQSTEPKNVYWTRRRAEVITVRTVLFVYLCIAVYAVVVSAAIAIVSTFY